MGARADHGVDRRDRHRRVGVGRVMASPSIPGGRGRDGIVVIGGYGAVGRVTSTILGERFPGRVLAAGRSFDEAEALSLRTGRKVLPLGLDLANPLEVGRALDAARIVVACAGRDDAEFARECLDRSIHYVDVSASYPFLLEVERSDALARERDATAVLSVGLAPGLTNLLAKYCTEVLDAVRSLDIFVLLGLGEAHGEAAVRWTVKNLGKRFQVPGIPGTVGGFEDPRTTLFPGGYGERTAYRFDFADQHVVARTLGVESVATRLCFDPASATRLVALLKRTGAFRALRNRRTQEAFVKLLSRVRIGSDAFAVKVDAEGSVGGRPRAYAGSIRGRGEGRATAMVATLVAERLYTTPFERGVFHIEQLFDPSEVFPYLVDHGLALHLGS